MRIAWWWGGGVGIEYVIILVIFGEQARARVWGRVSKRTCWIWEMS